MKLITMSLLLMMAVITLRYDKAPFTTNVSSQMGEGRFSDAEKL